MPVYKYTKECNQPYNLILEDTGEYYPGWVPVTNSSGMVGYLLQSICHCEIINA